MSKVNYEAYCKICGKTVTFQVNQEDLDEFFNTPRNERRLVQDIFHYLTPQEREMLLSNTCDMCWHRACSFCDDEEVDE